MFVFDVILDDENELKMFGYCVIGFTRIISFMLFGCDLWNYLVWCWI